MKEHADLIVVGAGMVGMACALGMAQKGYSVILLESQAQKEHHFPTENDIFDHRVVAISRASEQLFQELGIWPAIASSRISSYQDMLVWDSERDGSIHFSASTFFEPNLGYIIEQKVILSALWQAIQKQSTITPLFNITIRAISQEESYAVVELSDQQLKAKVIIGADGMHSTISRLFTMGAPVHDYQQTAVVATLEGSQPHHARAYQRFAADGPLAWLPLSEPYFTSIVWSTTPEYAKVLCSCSVEEFEERVTRENEGKLGKLSLRGERFSFPLKAHHAKTYVLSRVALVGDAAHSIHPLAGMGVNLGFLDVATLMALFEKAKVLKRDPGRLSWLTRYERERRWHNGVILQSMSLFKVGFGSSSPWGQWVRNQLLNYVDRQSSVKRFFMQKALFG